MISVTKFQVFGLKRFAKGYLAHTEDSDLLIEYAACLGAFAEKMTINLLSKFLTKSLLLNSHPSTAISSAGRGGREAAGGGFAFGETGACRQAGWSVISPSAKSDVDD